MTLRQSGAYTNKFGIGPFLNWLDSKVVDFRFADY